MDLGNQLWQHTIAFAVAESLRAKLYVAVLPEALYIDGVLPPNTYTGALAMAQLLPDEFEYSRLPATAPERILCDAESFYFSDRPRDWRNSSYTQTFKSNALSIFSDPSPRCVRLLGYFQNYPFCVADARALWTARLLANNSHHPGPSDLSVYLRCLPRHYHFNGPAFYRTVLSGLSFERLWLFQAPECPSRLSSSPHKDGVVATVVRLLITEFNATRWPGLTGAQAEDETAQLLHDLAGLAQSKRLLLPVSSWAFWAGLLSNGAEVHVNAPPHHSNMGTAGSNYVYHNEREGRYFGRFNATTGAIDYALVLSSALKSAKNASVSTPLSISIPLLNTTDVGLIFD